MNRRLALALTTAAATALAVTACQFPPSGQSVRAGGTQGAGVPSGTVVAYYGTDIPAGWILCDGRLTSSGRRTPDLRNRFVMGLDPASPDALGETGGAAAHQHVAETGQPKGESEEIESGNDQHAADDDHTHTVKVQAAAHLPPYVRLVYIMKD